MIDSAMRPAESSAAFQEADATLKCAGDPEERQRALLCYYVSKAQTQAAAFCNHVLQTGHRADEDLAARAQAALDPMLDLFLRNNERLGLAFPDFTDVTRSGCSIAFFDRLNKLLGLALQPPQGTA